MSANAFAALRRATKKALAIEPMDIQLPAKWKRQPRLTGNWHRCEPCIPFGVVVCVVAASFAEALWLCLIGWWLLNLS